MCVCVEEEGYNYTSFGVQREPPTLVKHRQIVLAFNFMPEINIITIIVLYMRWLHTFPLRHPPPHPCITYFVQNSVFLIHIQQQFFCENLKI